MIIKSVHSLEGNSSFLLIGFEGSIFEYSKVNIVITSRSGNTSISSQNESICKTSLGYSNGTAVCLSPIGNSVNFIYKSSGCPNQLVSVPSLRKCSVEL
jgi:hypothetical protein